MFILINFVSASCLMTVVNIFKNINGFIIDIILNSWSSYF